MATLKGIYTPVAAAADDSTYTEIGRIRASATSAKGKIAEIIVSNEGTTDVNYTIKLNRQNPNENESGSVQISPKTILAAGDVHVKPMSTFIRGGDTLEINADGAVKTVVSIIEL